MDYYNKNETAKILNTTLDKLKDDYINTGLLKPMKIGGKIVFEKKHVLKANIRAAGIKLTSSGKSLNLIAIFSILSVLSNLIMTFVIKVDSPESIEFQKNIVIAINSIFGVIIFVCFINTSGCLRKSGEFLSR
jgi:hypothetical protein